MSIKGTRTEQNLLKAFAGESQARNRYTYYATIARNEGYEQIAALFEETADNEKVHAKVFYKYLEGGEVEITASYPAGTLRTTAENLLHAAEGELMEWDTLYPSFADVAEEEGFPKVASSFREIAKAEAFHEARYRKLLANVESGTVFKGTGTQKWHCRHCGYISEGLSAPDICPSCVHPQKYYELLAENY